MFQTSFLTTQQAKELAEKHGTPLYAYSRQKLEEMAQTMLSVPAPYGLTIRFAMKANPHQDILEVFKNCGVKIDASSGYEAEKAIAAGFAPEDILLTSQQIPDNLKQLVEKGTQYNATSLRQLEVYGDMFGNKSEPANITVRINPGIGSGHSVKVNVGGISSSFGIWHEYIPQVFEIAKTKGLSITRLHTHIGAGTDPEVWQQAAKISLELVRQFPDVKTLNLGGGFKVARVEGEQSADMAEIGAMLESELVKFAQETGRELYLELEPGTLLVANAGIMLAQVEDIVDTGKEGYTFLKLNTGMNDILRPTLYGSQHPILVISDSDTEKDYVVVGHNCESGDLLTPAPGDPETLQTRSFSEASIRDVVMIGGTGAYCAAMSAKGYNSYPDAQELLID